MPRRGVAGSSSSSMSNFLRNHQTDFLSGCTNLQSHQQWRSVTLSPHPCQHLLSPEFLILAILTVVRYDLRVVFICISLMIKDVEHFFKSFSALLYSSVENSLFSTVSHFVIGLFEFLEFSFLSSLYTLDISPPIRFRIDKNSFLICWGPFCLINSVLCLTEALQFYEAPSINVTAQAIAVQFRNFSTVPILLEMVVIKNPKRD